MRIAFTACAVVLLCGCPHFYKLDVKNVTALDVSGVTSDGSPGKLLCARSGLVDVLATTKDGSKHQEGQHNAISGDQFDPDLVQLSASVGSFNDRSWNPPADPLSMLKVQSVTITAALKANPQITSQVTLKPTWACEAPVANASGNDGQSGNTGAAGGSNAAGGIGDQGEHGGNGLPTTVEVGWIQGPNGERLALAAVHIEGGTDGVYIFDPSTPLTVNATGGNGGEGGTGGWGGDTQFGPGGARGGRGGNGGDGGNGATVVLRYDSSTPELAQLVRVDFRSGAGGPPGGGGGGGTSKESGHSGDSGPSGESGQDGQPGGVRPQPTRGVNQEVAALAASGQAPAMNAAPAAAASQAAPTAVAVPPDTRGVEPSADGARLYAGTATLDATMAGERPLHQKQTTQVLSTRTRRRHFTIAFKGGQCTLQFHRPPNENGYHYVLDAPSQCVTPVIAIQVTDATLELDPKTDQLGVSWTGTAKGDRGPISLSLKFVGKRK